MIGSKPAFSLPQEFLLLRLIISQTAANPIVRQELQYSLLQGFVLENEYANVAPDKVVIRLGANENPWEPSEKTKQALRSRFKIYNKV